LPHSQVLNLIDDAEVNSKVLWSKKNFITTGSPNQPTLEEFYDWQTSRIDYLEFLPGYQNSMPNTCPIFEFRFVEQLHRKAECYDSNYKILMISTTEKNPLNSKQSHYYFMCM
jgi:hypothetical protein